MNLEEYFSIWNKLTKEQQNRLEQAAFPKKFEKGKLIQNGSLDCQGLLIMKSGQLRAFIASEEGREITIYRLFEMDICLFSASCMMNSIQFDITIEAEKDSEVWIIPPKIYKEVMEESAPLANYTNQIMGSRFSEVMWLLEQIMWKSLDKRLAAFLIEETYLEETKSLKVTHEKIANHMGTAREVVTRMLKYFQGEGHVKLTRGTIEIISLQGLEEIMEQ